MIIDTSKECVQKILIALPFANADAGLRETGELIKMLFDELEQCRNSKNIKE